MNYPKLAIVEEKPLVKIDDLADNLLNQNFPVFLSMNERGGINNLSYGDIETKEC